MNLASAGKKLSSSAAAALERVNPIVVKEFRQAVQNRLVVSVLILFLMIDLLVMGLYLLSVDDVPSQAAGGRSVFMPLLCILLITCMGFVPLYAAVRLSLERNDTNIDLFFVTTITPAAIVRGKFLTATALTMLIFSASTPFLTLTYLLRGIDLPMIFFTLWVGFCLCVVANALGVFVGCVPGSWFIRGLVALGAIICLIYMVGVMIEELGTYITYGIRMSMSSWEFWRIHGSFLLMGLLAVGLLHVFSIALLSPKPSNRMFVPRLYLTAAWAISGLVLGLWSLWEKSDEPLAAWVIGSGIAFTVMLVAASGERDAWGTRVRRTIPRNPLGRVVAFIFYTGSAGGITWCTIMLCATAITALIGSGIVEPRRFAASSDLFGVVGTMACIFGYFLCYCLTAAAVRALCLKQLPNGFLPLAALMIGAATCIVPFVLVLVLSSGRREVGPELMIFNPFVLGMSDSFGKSAAPVVLMLWLGVSLLASAVWFLEQWQRFVPCRPARCPDVLGAMPSTGDEEDRPVEVAAP